MQRNLDLPLLDFLKNSSWGLADAVPLTQDASARRYFRLMQPDGRSAVLMDATTAPKGELGRFLAIGAHLRDIGLSAPEVFEQNPTFLILEDFGDARFVDVPADQTLLYQLALDVLLHLQAHPAPLDLPLCDARHLGDLAATAWQWYPASATGERDGMGDHVADIVTKLATSLALDPQCAMLRDYHAENLMWLPDRMGIRRAGILDFQDAMLGDPAFDVVSLLQDARRDVDPDFERDMRLYFQSRSGCNADDFEASYAALGAIRNLRILGMFARLARLLGRPQYLDFMPRVWRYLTQDLAHPALEDLRMAVADSLPQPTASHLEILKTSCPNSRHP